MRIGIDLDGVVIDSETSFRTYEEIFAIENLNGDKIVDREEPKFQSRYNWTKEQEDAIYKKDSNIEVNRSNFILWNSEIEEPIKVEKVGSQIDVLPTLLNLFGVKYDSRMIIGKDILSDYEGLAIFSNRSWVSDYGYYNSGTRKFTLKEGKNLDDESVEDYVKRINNRVANSFSISIF